RVCPTATLIDVATGRPIERIPGGTLAVVARFGRPAVETGGGVVATIRAVVDHARVAVDAASSVEARDIRRVSTVAGKPDLRRGIVDTRVARLGGHAADVRGRVAGVR